MTPLIVALTGGIGSGKSHVANIFSRFGVPLVDTDVIARELLQPKSLVLDMIVEYFGLSVIRKDYSLDRSKLRARIFRNQKEKTWLNSFLHPIILEKSEQQFRTISAPYLLWIVPLLVENNLQQRANRVLVVHVDPEIQIARTVSRDKISREEVIKILRAQVSSQRRLDYANDIIHNNGLPEEVIESVTMLHHLYLKLAHQ
ncbi:dephospho-CoA kinase [secondary endosymbiont of Heteropsylla cubana]|uniref:Dephospho-CoA kinase n=1 Tax=secondary endosymbiont of Heteropsylla cubana TaxID=134287 RepID=J3TYH3_9ENTR|nr:dephospho-CoA kinase [secondary endosymbiont of Heteropsylla cubana]AFP85410.1 dephospho-CoA kinase [secondary endosymbiont of Heteropsylla cubana]